MPTRLRGRLDALEPAVVEAAHPDAAADPDVLLAVATAIRACQELRFDYRPPADAEPEDDPPAPRRVQPHHLLARAGRWYMVAWEPTHGDWRIYRADRMAPRIPLGPRFTAREIPGGDPMAFVGARFKGSTGADTWPCQGGVVLHRSAADVLPFVGDGTVEALGPDRCRLRLGSWSWPGLAARIAAFDADIEAAAPAELRNAFADLARRAARAAGGHPGAGPEAGAAQP
jgi:predicted DNA-binding transcriptional regulator YafY